MRDDAQFWRDLLAAMTREIDDGEYGQPWRGTENAPGHAHDVPGVWDTDNGSKAGKPCAWCMTWNRARAALAASPAPAIPAYPAKHISLKMRRDRKIVLTLELDAVEGAPAYLLTPVNPCVVRSAPAISESDLLALLPGTTYMDEPDGGSPSLLEQLQRMAKDAARYRRLRDKHDGDGPAAAVRCLTGPFFNAAIHGERLDAAIDAARKGEKS